MPRKYKYVVMHRLPKVSDEWTPIEDYLGQAEHTFKTDAVIECNALKSQAISSNVQYSVTKVTNTPDANEQPGQAARKRVRRSPPSAATRDSGSARSPGLLRQGSGRPQLFTQRAQGFGS